MELTTHLRDALLALAQANPDDEILGVLGADGAGRVVAHEAVGLTESHPDHAVFTVDALDTARQSITDAGRAVVGIYHSHPHGFARPSERDRLLIGEGEVMVVIGLRSHTPEITGWRLTADRYRVVEEPLT